MHLTIPGGFDYGYFPEEEITFTTVFLVNETSMKFGVRIIDDNMVETTETFTASLSMPSDETIQQLGYDVNPNPASLQIGHHGNTVVSIIDNDGKMKFCHYIYNHIPTCTLVYVWSDGRYCLLVTSSFSA